MNVDAQAKMIWDYMLLKHKLRKCDVIFVLGSRDERVAEYGAKLFLEGYGEWLVISGGVDSQGDPLRKHWKGTEAEHFTEIALKIGVPQDKIIVENEAKNTGENVRLTYALLDKQNLHPASFLLVQKPYMERRTYAAFAKQWPDHRVEFIVSSPPIPYKDYFDEHNPKDDIINIMVGDLQRIREYPKRGFQIEQEIPDDVQHAYEELVRFGYTDHLIK